MASSLLEMKALYGDDPMKMNLIDNFLEGSESRVLPYLNFVDSSALFAFNFAVDTGGGDVSERSINDVYPDSNSVTTPRTERLTLFGGAVKTDQMLIDDRGDVARLTAIQRRMKRMGKYFDKLFFHGQEVGTVTRQAKQFAGIRKRCTAKGRVIWGGTNGGVLTADMLDQGLDMISGENSNKLIFCSRKMRRSITNILRAQAGGKDMVQSAIQVKDYDGAPIVTVEEDESRNKIFDFVETRGSSSLTQSVYIVRMGGKDDESDLQGIIGKSFMKQRQPANFGEYVKDVIDNSLGICDFSDNCILRLGGLTG
jgi:hypothetical protein